MTEQGIVTNHVELDRIAVQETLRLVRTADDKDWDRPTPCTGWTFHDLLAHMTAQNNGFAAAARGEGGLSAYWRVHSEMDDPAGAYAHSVASLLIPFAEHGGTEREFVLPELGGAFPGRVAVSFHLLDIAVHAWDLAVTTGSELRLPPAVWDAVLPIARRVPAGTPFFAAALTEPPGASALEATLRTLGRDPHWSPDDQEAPRPL